MPDGNTISDDRSRFDLDVIHAYLSRENFQPLAKPDRLMEHHQPDLCLSSQ